MSRQRVEASERAVIRRAGGVPWPWLLAGTLVIAGALALGLPLVGGLGAQPSGTASPGLLVPPAARTNPVAPGGPALAPPAQPAAPSAPIEPPRLDLAEARTLIDERHALVIDARDRNAYREGHIPGAINVSPLDAESWARAGDRGRPILIYCE